MSAATGLTCRFVLAVALCTVAPVAPAQDAAEQPAEPSESSLTTRMVEQLSAFGSEVVTLQAAFHAIRETGLDSCTRLKFEG